MGEEKDQLKAERKALALQLGVMQREARQAGIPVMIIVEGLDASEKGLLLNQMLLEMDSRGYKVFSTHASEKERRQYPLLWRYWNHSPARNMIQVFDRSYYYLALDGWAEGKLSEKALKQHWKDANFFERQLSDDGALIVKIFLTVPRKDQAKRLRQLEGNPKTAWRVTAKDWERHRLHKAYMDMVRKMIQKTDTPAGHWNVIDTADVEAACTKLYRTVIDRLHQAVAAKPALQSDHGDRPWIPYQGKNYLAKVAYPIPAERSDYKQTLREKQVIIHELVHELHSKQIPVVMAYCGWDAAGKGGCIKRLLQGMDPRSYEVTPIGAPTKEELNHHYFWRFWKQMPKRGRIAIFDRSWYGRVLVERVEALCANKEWQRAYDEINEVEAHLARYGTVVIKFWLQIDKETQLERFSARKENPYKQWKITDEDWRNREKWDLYVEAVNEMVERTDKPHAPWSIIPANCKMNARLQTLDVFIERVSEVIPNYRKARL